MKKILSLLLCLCMVFGMFSTTVFAIDGFEDTNNHWAETSIARWAEAGIIYGVDAEGTLFNPGGIMTRGQAATIFARLLKLSVRADVSNFTDLKGNPYADSIALCVEAGILEGMSSTIMDPDGPLTREQMMVMLCRALNIQPEETREKEFEDDHEVSDWAEGYINALINAGIVGGISATELAPGDDMNRASVMALLDKAIAAYGDEENETITVPEGKKGVILVVADGVVAEDVPVGTIIVTGTETTGTVVNGNEVAQDTVTEALPEPVEPEPVDPTPVLPVVPSTPSTPSTPSHTHSYTYTYNGDGGTHQKVCSCGTITESCTYVDGVCEYCGHIAVPEATYEKFWLNVAGAGSSEEFPNADAKVNVKVEDNYVATLTVDNGRVNATTATVTVGMNNVGSLGVEGEREHSITVNSGINEDADLAAWLGNVFFFEEAIVQAEIETPDGSFRGVVYNVNGTPVELEEDEALSGNADYPFATITATPNSTDNARYAWQLLTSHVETSTQTEDNSYIELPEGAYLVIGTEKLDIDTELTVDNANDFDALEEAIRDAATLRVAEGDYADVQIYLPQGTVLAVGNSIAELKNAAIITVDLPSEWEDENGRSWDPMSEDGLGGILEKLQAMNGENKSETLKNMVTRLNYLVGALNQTYQAVNVNIKFAPAVVEPEEPQPEEPQPEVPETRFEAYIKGGAESAANAEVNVKVQDNYVATLTVGNGVVDASSVTVGVSMTDVEGLGISGTKSHEMTVETELDNDANLGHWLHNAFYFAGATVNVDVDGNRFTYNVTGDPVDVDPDELTGEASYTATIVATPSETADAQAAWAALTANITTGESTDSSIFLPEGSYLFIAGEKLDIGEGGLTINNVNDFDALETAIRDAATLTTGELGYADVEIYLAKETMLAVDTTKATLDKDVVIKIDLPDEAMASTVLGGTLSELQGMNDENQTQILKNMVTRFDNLIVALNNKTIDVTVEFTA